MRNLEISISVPVKFSPDIASVLIKLRTEQPIKDVPIVNVSVPDISAGLLILMAFIYIIIKYRRKS